MVKKRRVLREIRPNLGTRTAYSKAIKQQLKEMADSLLYWIGAEYKRQLPRLAQDAENGSINAAITSRFDAQTKRWEKSNREAAQRFAGRFADQTRADAVKGLNRSFEAAGLAMRATGSRAINAMAQLQKTQVIDTTEQILQGFLKGVTNAAMQGLINGASFDKVKKDVHRKLEKTEKRVGNTARSLSNNLTQNIVKVHNEKLGLYTHIWIHVPGKKYSRKTHEEFDGQEFDIREGLYDREVGEYVMPGQLNFCMCTCRIVVPEWLR